MRAIQIASTGGPEVLVATELPDPRPGDGEVLVELAAAGVNYIDVYHRTGHYPLELPAVIGLEGTGTVRAVGAGVERFAAGDRICWPQIPRSYASLVAVPAERAVAVPDDVSDEVAAAIGLQGMTAHYLVRSTYPVRDGDDVLVHAAAGGVGLLLCQLAKARGARVIGTASTGEKAQRARDAGADEVLDSRRPGEIAARVRELTDGRGVHVAYDGVGRDTFDQSLAALRVRGVLVLFGAASGPVDTFDLQRLNSAGSLFVTRPSLGHYLLDRRELDWRASELFDALAGGALTFAIGGSYPLDAAAGAHRDLEARRTTGKLVLVP